MIAEYERFIAGKLLRVEPTGFAVNDSQWRDMFPHQRLLTRWALARGRAAIFADTGLGKTRMQLHWAHEVARKTGTRVLILAPLAVGAQTVAEARSIGIDATHCRDESQTGDAQIVVTNYERLHLFDTTSYGGVVLDESSCIKHHDTRTFATLTDTFARTVYKLCTTATPSPNDWTELGTHAEFLGVCSRAEMLAEFFVHDAAKTQDWRLKGHAREAFWQWVCEWGAMIRRPSDLGFSDEAYELPPLVVTEHTIATDDPIEGMLFAMPAQTLSERRTARRQSLEDRVALCARNVNATDEPWIVWCDLNAEADALRAAIPDAIEVRGSDDADHKERSLVAFSEGRARVLITKPSIAGFGMNWQHCARMAFVGVTDSYEAYYQAIRRCWRFGQRRPVEVHVFASEMEGAVVANLRRKEAIAQQMADSLSDLTREAVRENVCATTRQTNAYHARGAVVVPMFIQQAKG